MSRDPWSEVLKELTDLKRAAESELDFPHLDVVFEEPPEQLGDIGFPVHPYASHLRRPPQEIAEDFAKTLRRSKLLASHSAVSGYVNSVLDRKKFANLVLESISENPEDYGSLPSKGVRVILEHTSVNPTGPMHVGRARNPIIGDSLARIMKRAGYEIMTEYLINDVGKQAVLITWGVNNIEKDSVERPEREKPDHRTVPYYRKASQIAEENPEVRKEVEELILRFERGDKEVAEEVRKVCEKVIEGILQSLSEISVEFDSFFWESDLVVDGTVHSVVEKLKESDLCFEEEGAYYLDLEGFGIHGRDSKFFITRSDGTTLYTTRDLAYHLNKFERCDIAINVLGEDQKLEQQQLACALRIMGVDRIPEPVYYAFVSLPEGRMSTRKGRVVHLDDLIDEAIERAYQEVKIRREDLTEKEMQEIARIVGVGAIRYNLVRVQPEKRIVFRWEEALNFEGNSAPFLQYAHARTCGILRKAGEIGKWDPSTLQHESEHRLLLHLAKFPSKIGEAAESRKPHIIASYAYELASLFNQFYRDCPVLHSEEPTRSSRLTLVDSTRAVLRTSLDCLGVVAPERM